MSFPTLRAELVPADKRGDVYERGDMDILGGLLGLVLLVLWWLVMGDTLMGWVQAPFRWLRSRKLDPDD